MTASDYYLWRIVFRSKEFLITPCGSWDPNAMLSSFVLEHELRERWWDIEEGDIVADVGAGFGSYTLPALTCGASRVLAWEPDKSAFNDLCTNLVVNGFLDRCLAMNVLASRNSCLTQPFYPFTHSVCRESSEIKAEQRTSLSVDDAVSQYSFGRLDWLKIDVEGDEVNVLQGSTKVLRELRPKLLIENHVGFVPGIDQQVRDILTPLGYVEENFVGEGVNDNWSKWEPR